MNTTENAELQLNTVPFCIKIIITIAMVFVSLLGTLGNILVIYVLGYRKKKVIIF